MSRAKTVRRAGSISYKLAHLYDALMALQRRGGRSGKTLWRAATTARAQRHQRGSPGRGHRLKYGEKNMFILPAPLPLVDASRACWLGRANIHLSVIARYVSPALCCILWREDKAISI